MQAASWIHDNHRQASSTYAVTAFALCSIKGFLALTHPPVQPTHLYNVHTRTTAPTRKKEIYTASPKIPRTSSPTRSWVHSSPNYPPSSSSPPPSPNASLPCTSPPHSIPPSYSSPPSTPPPQPTAMPPPPGSLRACLSRICIPIAYKQRCSSLQRRTSTVMSRLSFMRRVRYRFMGSCRWLRRGGIRIVSLVTLYIRNLARWGRWCGGVI